VASGQNLMDTRFDGSEKGKSLGTVLDAFASKANARIFFRPEWVESLIVEEDYTGRTLGYVLDELFTGSELYYLVMYPTTLVIVKDPTQALRRKKAIETALLKEEIIKKVQLGESHHYADAETVTVTGKIVDVKTGDPIPYATIQVIDSPYGTTTGQEGSYVLRLPPGSYIANFSFVEYDNVVVDLLAYEDGELNLEVEKKSVQLEEVIIQGEVAPDLSTSRIGQVEISVKDLKRAPAFLGEADLVKQVQNLPGVTTAGEAASGYNVRGGSVDQNLILYDGLPVFNSSHVFGFFSAFNPEAVRDASFYKGGIPAEYGGRASSVLDIKSKDGSFEKWGGKAGIGMITSNVAIDGPVKADKTAVAASFRSTYSNWLAHSIRTDYADLRKSDVSFYDATLKVTHLHSDRTRISFTGYSSNDSFSLAGDSTYRWHNFQASGKVNHQYHSNLAAEFVGGVSQYGYSVTNSDPLTASELSYQITTAVMKAGFNSQIGDHKLNFGWQLMQYTFQPGRLRPESQESNARDFSLQRQFSLENALYITDELTLNDRLFVEGGARLPSFVSLGPSNVNIYRENFPLETGNVVDTVHFKAVQPVKAYVGLEPRLSARWMADPNSSFKLGYNRMYQFLHLVTNTTAVTPVDIWQPSGYYFKPQRADQASLGYFRDFNEKAFGASTEVYYKHIKNILDFKDGAQLILNDHLETELLQGIGRTYGIETSFFKNNGRLTGTLNYTFSRSFRQIKGPTPSESINGGKQYPASYDQPHIVNLSWKFNISRRHYFTGNFTYHTGRPVTIPLSVFTSEHTTVAYFSTRNQYRIPDYHRLDLALVIEGNHKRKKWAEGTWVFSVYNAYARKNPYTVFFNTSAAGVPKPYQLSIIGTIFPSLNFNLKF
jgi:hypothetical protein